MTPDPWEIVGWMIVGGVAGLALGAVLAGTREALGDIHRAFGWKGSASLLAVATLGGLWLFAPRWTFVLALLVALTCSLLWLQRRALREIGPSTTEDEGGPD